MSRTLFFYGHLFLIAFMCFLVMNESSPFINLIDGIAIGVNAMGALYVYGTLRHEREFEKISQEALEALDAQLSQKVAAYEKQLVELRNTAEKIKQECMK